MSNLTFDQKKQIAGMMGEAMADLITNNIASAANLCDLVSDQLKGHLVAEKQRQEKEQEAVVE